MNENHQHFDMVIPGHQDLLLVDACFCKIYLHYIGS